MWGAFDIVPGPGVLLHCTRGLYVGTAGNVQITMAEGETVTLNNLDAGVIHRLRVTHVLAPGTTALNIIGLY